MSEEICRRSLVLGIIMLFFLSGIFLIEKCSADGINIYVDDNADPSWYDATHVKTIQEGINNSTSGDTVCVHNGTYSEKLIVNKSINLIGENRNSSIIQGNGTGTVINITANNVNISNFSLNHLDHLYNIKEHNGIKINSSSYVTIKNCNIFNNSDGIRIFSYCTNVTINGNNFTSNGYAVDFFKSNTENTTICNNSFYKTGRAIRFVVPGSNPQIGHFHTAICNNYFSENAIAIYSEINCNNTIINNNVFNSHVFSVIDCIDWNYSQISNNMFNDNDYGIKLKACDFSNISNNTIDTTETIALELTSCDNCMISKNVISNSTWSIQVGSSYLGDSENNTFFYNTIKDNDVGLYLAGENSYLIGNNIHNNSASGIIVSSSNNMLLNNSAYFNEHGILLQSQSNNNKIMNNTLSLNRRRGIYLTTLCNNNTIVCNTCSQNGEQGIIIYSSCNHNTIAENHIFMNNDTGLYLYLSCTNNNISYNTIENNYLRGINVYTDSNNNFIYENNITSNGELGGYQGIYLYNCDDNIVIKNNVCSNYGSGLYLNSFCNNTIITENILNSNVWRGLMLYSSCNNNEILNNDIKFNGEKGLLIYSSCNNNVILGNNISFNNKSGTHFYLSCDNNTISNNTVYENGCEGILFESSCFDNIIINNTISYNEEQGILLYSSCENNVILKNMINSNNWSNLGLWYSCSNNTIIENDVLFSQGKYGMYFYSQSNNNKIMANTVAFNRYYGVLLHTSSYNNLTNNIISNNQHHGIRIYSSNENTLCSNNIYNNLYYGINVTQDSSDNCIYLNNFLFNNNGSVQAYDANESNSWDDGALGNYWEDYTLRYPSALNISGIWNTPYDIDGATDTRDYYPLVNPAKTELHVLYCYKINPNHGPNSKTISILVDGLGFTEGLTATLLKDGTEIEGDDTSILSEFQFMSSFNLTWKQVGIWDLQVTITSGESFLLKDAFEIKDFLYDIYPKYGYNITKNLRLNIYGDGFKQGCQVILSKDGEESIIGTETIVMGEKNIVTKVNLSGKTLGNWSITVGLPTGQQSTLSGIFDIIEIPECYYYNPDIIIQAGALLDYDIIVSDTDNLFVTLQKTSLVNYGQSWYGNLSVLYDDVVLASTEGCHDHMLHIKNPTPGYYKIRVTSNHAGSGILTVQTELPGLPLGDWIVDTIYTSYGSVWYQVEVPSNQDSLFFDGEGMGYWSHFIIYYEQYGGTTCWISPEAYYDLHTSMEIPDPASGTYIIEFIDSAMIRGTIYDFNPNQSREVLLKADTSTSIDSPPDYLPFISDINPDTGGNNGFVTVEINGGWLGSNASVKLTKSGCEDIVAENVRENFQETSLLATFNLSSKEPGEWSLILTNPNGINTTSVKKFIIEESHGTELWAEVLGRETVRAGRKATYFIKYGNSGNQDVSLAYMFVLFPKNISGILSDNYDHRTIEIKPYDFPPDYNLSVSGYSTILRDIYAGHQGELSLTLSFEEEYEKVDLEIYLLDLEQYSQKNLLTKTDNNYNFIKSDSSEYVPIYPEVWISYDVKNGVHIEHWVVTLPDENGKYWTYSTYEGIDGWETGIREIPENFFNYLQNEKGWIRIPGNKEGYQLTKSELQQFRSMLDSTLYGNKKWIHDEYNKKSILDGSGNCFGWIEWAAEQAGINNGKGFVTNWFYDYYDLSLGMANVFGIPRNKLPPWYCRYFPEGYWYWWNFLEKDDMYKTFQTFWIVYASTPEDKYGYSGFDSEFTNSNDYHFVKSEQHLYYRIDFWNKENATASACNVYVNDQLDENLNWSTFKFEEIGFLNWTVKLEPCQYFNIYVDTRPEMNYIVNVEGLFDPSTGAINWTFITLDPVTYDTPDDPLAGFLAPITDSGYEIGWVCFSVDPNSNLSTGTQIKNQAFVNFDGVGPFNPAPKQGPYINTIDAEPPTCNMTGEYKQNSIIKLTWNGTDDFNGSGIKDYSIYYSEDGSSYLPLLLWTKNTTFNFSAEPGQDYYFYCIARDNVGNTGSYGTVLEVLYDINSPTTIKIVGYPKFGPNDRWVTNLSEFNLSSTDDISGVNKTCYRTWYEGIWAEWIEYTDNFTLSGEGKHYLEYYSVDNVGNIEPMNNQTHYVDDSPPLTSLNISEPKLTTEDMIYVTPETMFKLVADDSDGSGISAIGYRIFNGTSDSGWQPYTDPFNLSCLNDGIYYIEYNSTDNLQNEETTNVINVTLFSWNYNFEDTDGRNTILKINTDYEFIQFINPDKDFGIKEATHMWVWGKKIIIWHEDNELELFTISVNTKIDFCIALAKDLQTSTWYMLVDEPGIE